MVDDAGLYWLKNQEQIVGKAALQFTPEEQAAFAWFLDHNHRLKGELGDVAHHAGELSARNSELEALAAFDELTGIGNRRWFNLRAQQLHKKICEEALYNNFFVFFDLDSFKLFNDTYGHKFGDDIIKFTAEHLSKSFESIDEHFRYGGDEFVTIMRGVRSYENLPNNATYEDAQRSQIMHARDIARNVIDQFEKRAGIYLRKNLRRDQPIPTVGISGGIARIEPDRPWEESLKLADKAMYQAKEHDNDSVCFID